MQAKCVSPSFEFPPQNANLRSVFTSYPGYQFMEVDYASQEAALPTFFSGETVWLDALLGDLDFHKSTAAALYKIPYDKVEKWQRQNAKKATFLMLFGGSAAGLSKKNHIPLQQAQEIVDRFYSGLPMLVSWFNSMHEFVHQNGYLWEMFGRRRIMSHWLNQGRQGMGYVDRSSQNNPTQGGGGNIMRVDLARFYAKVLDPKWQLDESDIILLGSVHDAMISNIIKSIDPLKAVALFQDVMCYPLPGMQPYNLLKPQPSLGPNWGNQLEIPVQQCVLAYLKYDVPYFFKSKKVIHILRQFASDPSFPYRDNAVKHLDPNQIHPRAHKYLEDEIA